MKNCYYPFLNPWTHKCFLYDEPPPPKCEQNTNVFPRHVFWPILTCNRPCLRTSSTKAQIFKFVTYPPTFPRSRVMQDSPYKCLFASLFKKCTLKHSRRRPFPMSEPWFRLMWGTPFKHICFQPHIYTDAFCFHIHIKFSLSHIRFLHTLTSNACIFTLTCILSVVSITITDPGRSSP